MASRPGNGRGKQNGAPLPSGQGPGHSTSTEARLTCPGDRIEWAVAVCGATVLAAEPLTIALLRRLAVLDLPGARSSHSVPTPRGGGAPIAAGLIAATAIAPGGGQARFALAAAIGFFGLLGLLDDLRSLSVLSRLLLQAAAAAAVAWVHLSVAVAAFSLALAMPRCRRRWRSGPGRASSTPSTSWTA